MLLDYRNFAAFQRYDGLLSSVRLCFDLNSALPACTAGMFSSNFTLSLIAVLGFVLKTFACDAQVPHPPEDTSSVRFQEKTVFRTLGTGFSVLTDALSHATRKRRVLYTAPRQRLVLLYLTTLLVSNSYSPEPNPGPSTDHSSSPANSQSRSLIPDPLVVDLLHLRSCRALERSGAGLRPVWPVVSRTVSECGHHQQWFAK